MIKVIIESPYAGDIKKNLTYAKRCVKDSLLRGESPIASHLLYTQEGILDDSVPAERRLGIVAGLSWRESADKHVFYVDRGWSPGMEYAKKWALGQGFPVEVRSLDEVEGSVLIGKTISKAEESKKLDGGVKLFFTDGTIFECCWNGNGHSDIKKRIW